MMNRFSRRAIGPLMLTLAALPAAAPVAPASAAPAPADDLAAVNRAIRSITTLRADFQQVDQAGQVLTGKLQLKQPGHIRFDYGAGVGLLIVADGASLYVVDYEVRQVQRWPIRNSPLGALLDPKRDLARYGKLAPTGDPRIVSVEVRDPAHPEYGVISLIFIREGSAPGGLRLYGWIAQDAQGNRTTIRLSNVSYGAAIGDAAFRWVDPRKRTLPPGR